MSVDAGILESAWRTILGPDAPHLSVYEDRGDLVLTANGRTRRIPKHASVDQAGDAFAWLRREPDSAWMGYRYRCCQ